MLLFTPPPHTLSNLISHTGVKSYTVDLPTQTAEVNAEESLSYETVLEKIKKTGKRVNSGMADGEGRSVELTATA